MITSYVTINFKREFTKNKTGFGYMVYDIANSVGKKERVDVLCSDSVGESFNLEGVHYVARSYGLFFKNLLSCVPLMVFMKLWMNYKMTIGLLVRLFYYWLISGYVVNLIRKGNYDMIHIHQNVFDTEIWMAVCHKCDKKFVVTMHGLNSFSETVHLEPAGKKYERALLRRVVEGEFPITVISTGMKLLIERTFLSSNCNNIKVVCNAFSFPDVGSKIDIKQLYSIPDDSIIILCVGNVCKRKNQGQIIRAFDMIDDSITEHAYVLFIGGNLEEDYKIDNLIACSKKKSHYIPCGVISKDQLPNYYEQGNGVALMSLSEGFGLCLIEGLHFGLPSLTFCDVDAFVDIYDERVMIGVEDHSDRGVAEGIIRLLTKEWDRDIIKNYSKRFEPQYMADNYIKVFQELLAQ